MSASDQGVRALFGAPLKGSAPVYYVYVDEAGTSQHEPVTVVVGVIVHADEHWRSARDMVEQAYDKFVPADLRGGFIFHAKQVLGGYRDYKSWMPQDRLAFIGAIASVPRRLPAAISLGKVRRDSSVPPELDKRMSAWDFQHVEAFHLSIARADKFIRDWGKPSEVATVVAEDVPEKRRFLKSTLKIVLPSLPRTAEYLRPTADEQRHGQISQTSVGAIERIVDTVHFVEKADGPLLPIADACAFSFRRYFAQQSNGDQLVRQMLGCDLVWDDWQGPVSSMTFSFDSRKSYSTPYRPVYRL